MNLRRIPLYSPCCERPVLGDRQERYIYCFGCRQVLRSFRSRRRRQAALNAMKFTRSHCRVEVWLYGELIAYARDEPNLVHCGGMYRKEGRSTFMYFVNGSALVEALGLQQCDMQGGYRSLRQAGEALVHVLSKVGE